MYNTNYNDVFLVCEYKLKRYCLHSDVPVKPVKNQITSSGDAVGVANSCYDFTGDDPAVYECFYAILLNNQNKIMGFIKLGQGTIKSTSVDVKILAVSALNVLAESVIIFHNHPSGVLRPSSNDEEITKKIKNALAFLDIKLLDHLIIDGTNRDNYFSFADEGLL